MDRPVLKLDFGKYITGYWDGGKKRYGRFVPEQDFIPKVMMKWGCWELNFWFTAKSGVSWKTAAQAAKKRLLSITKEQKSTVEIEWVLHNGKSN